MEPPDISGHGEALQAKNLADKNNKSSKLQIKMLFNMFCKTDSLTWSLKELISVQKTSFHQAKRTRTQFFSFMFIFANKYEAP